MKKNGNRTSKLIILKILFLSLFAPNPSFSQTFTKSGFINFSGSHRTQDSQYSQQHLSDQTKNQLNSPDSIGNDSQIFLKLADKKNEEVEFGAIAKIELNLNSDGRNQNPNLDQIFTFFDSGLGKFELGNNQAVNQKMKAGPAKFARAAGGINGKYLEVINLPMSDPATQASHFIMLSQSPIGHGGYAKSYYRPNSNEPSGYHLSQFRALKDDSFEGVEDANKINYFSPNFSGFQLGLSYAPNSSNIGITKQTARDAAYTKISDIFSAAAIYSQDFDNLTVDLSTTVESGKSKNFQRKGLFAYDVGGSLSYFGFNVGAAYGNWGNSLRPEVGDYAIAGKSDYYTLGISYKFGPFAASITGIKSRFQNNKYRATSFGFDYKLTRNLMPYFELTKFGFDPESESTQANRGYVFLTGILYSF